MQFVSVEALYEAILGLLNNSVSVEFLIQFLDNTEVVASAPPSAAAVTSAAAPATTRHGQ